jgi:hypothetical protein
VANDNTLDGFNTFINDFPDAAQVPQAISKRNKLAFEQAKASGKLESIISFLKMYPNADQKNDALKLRNELAFQAAKKVNTIESFEIFIHTYPDAIQVSSALKLQKQLVFEKAKSINTFEAYSDFIRRYPEAEQYVDVFNLMANSLGQAIQKENSYTSSGIDWVKAFDNYGKSDNAAALIPLPDGTFILSGTTSDDSLNVRQGWFVKFGADWKMNWAKNYGNRLGISISTALVSGSGDIFASGYEMKNPMIRDSSSWLIKLNSQGLKYFDKEYEANAIIASSTAPGNQLVFSGFHSDSAGRTHYWIMEAKESGKKLWSRSYTGIGKVSNIKTDLNGKIFASCGRWIIKTDQDGYLLWEYTPESGDSLLKLDLSKNGEIFLAGLNRAKNLVIVRLSASGKLIARFVVPSVTGVNDISALKLSPANEILVGLNNNEGALFEKIGEKGQILNELKLSSPSNKIRDFMIAQQGGILLLVENYRKQTSWDIVLIKLK